jgi:hypothetical protein
MSRRKVYLVTVDAGAVLMITRLDIMAGLP